MKGQQVAVKQICLSSAKDPQKVRREVHLLSLLRGKDMTNIVQLLAHEV